MDMKNSSKGVFEGVNIACNGGYLENMYIMVAHHISTLPIPGILLELVGLEKVQESCRLWYH